LVIQYIAVICGGAIVINGRDIVKIDHLILASLQDAILLSKLNLLMFNNKSKALKFKIYLIFNTNI